MRPVFLPLAIALAVGAIFGTLSQGVRADHPHPPHEAKGSNVHDKALDLLRDTALGNDYRRTAERLAALLDPALISALDLRQRLLLLRYAQNQFVGFRPLARCWSPDTPIELLIAYHAIEEAARAHRGSPPPQEGNDPAADPPPAPANQFFRRWATTATNGAGQGVQGQPVTLTWSIVPDGTPIPSDSSIGDSSDPSNLRARLAQIYGGNTGPPADQPWFWIFQSVFASIGAQTGIIYVYEPNDDGQTLGGPGGATGTRGDIRLGGHNIDGNGSTLAYNYFPDDGDMVIDTNDNWFDNTSNQSVRLRNTVEHEHGHGLGMEHVCPLDQSKLMEPFINSNFRGIQFDEIYTLQRQYGDAFEHHSPARHNDTAATATPLPIVPGNPYSAQWLSIDDNSDLDYFALALPADAIVTARVIPSSIAYLEGPQNSNGSCSSGAAFDPSALHDLKLELLAPDQSDVLATANATPAGQPEEIADHPVSQSGTHFLRVTGGNANQAQLYRLEVAVIAPEISLALHAQAIVTESFSPPNGLIEPGETIELELTLINAGSLPATGVEAVVNGPAGFTDFTGAQDYGTIGVSGTLARRFVVGLEGECGLTIPLELTVTADGGLQKVIPLPLTLGSLVPVLAESFDGNGAFLPTGWTSEVTEQGSGWSVNASRSDSAPFSLHAVDVGDSAGASDVGTSSLLSPGFTLGGSGGSLTFRHFHDTEAYAASAYDGCVLELSVNAGPWQDILAAGAAFTTGGYNRTLNSGFNNPLAGRAAWSGDSADWFTTAVALPASLAGQPLRLRWRIGHDASVGVANGFEGWFIDDVSLLTADCAPTAPLVVLSLEDATTSEFIPLDLALLTFTTPLPSLQNLPIPLLNSGSATVGLDATGLDNIMIAAGQSSVEVSVQAVNDSEIEGDESFLLAIDPAAALAPAGLPDALLTVSDTPYGAWAASVLGIGTPNAPLEDRDDDGSLNIEEYVWQTDGASATSRPDLAPAVLDGMLRLAAPLATLPDDALLTAETSTDLEKWTTTAVLTLYDGFQVSADDPARFLRLIYELLPVAP